MNLIFFGPSGSGKDTQAEMLVEKFNYSRISTGDLLREISQGDRDIHTYVKESMNQGFLEDEFVYGLLQIYLRFKQADNLIMSGVVRKESQVELLDKVLTKINQKVDLAIYFELTDEAAVERMAGRLYCPNCKANFHKKFNPPKVDNICDICGSSLITRADDNEESIKRRLADFHKDNAAIMAAYESRGVLVKLDASKNIEDVHKDLLTVLQNYSLAG